MSSTVKPSDVRDDDLSISEILRGARDFLDDVSRQRQLLRNPILAALGVGIVFAFAGSVEYLATTQLIPYRSGTASSGLQGLAGLAGIRLPMNSATDVIISSEFYPDVARTLDFRISLAETPVAFSDGQRKRSAAHFFANEYRPSLLSLGAKYTVGLPGLLLTSLRRESPSHSVEVGSDSSEALRVIDRHYQRLIERIGERVSVAHNKKSGVITVGATMPDPVAAADLARVSAQQLMETVVSFEVRRAEEQLQFVERQYEEVRARHESDQRALAVFADRNRMLVSAVPQLERSRLEREAEVSFDLYQQLAREREQALIRRSQDTPTFSVLERATVPNYRAKPRRALILVLALFLGLAAGVARIGWRRYVG